MLPKIKSSHTRSPSLEKSHHSHRISKPNESHDVLLQNPKNLLYLHRDPMKITNRPQGSSLARLGPSSSRAYLPSPNRALGREVKMNFKNTKLAKELLRQRLSVQAKPMDVMWRGNNRSNCFTNRFMGCMFEDTSMGKELKKMQILQRARARMGKPLPH